MYVYGKTRPIYGNSPPPVFSDRNKLNNYHDICAEWRNSISDDAHPQATVNCIFKKNMGQHRNRKSNR